MLLLLASLASIAPANASELAGDQGAERLRSELAADRLLNGQDIELRSANAMEYPVEFSKELKLITCDVWLFILNGRANQVLHSDCPTFLHGAITESLYGSRWSVEGKPAEGALAVNVSHRKDKKTPGGIQTVFKPADDGRPKRQARPVYPTGVWPQPVELVCSVSADVDTEGRPIRVASKDCPEGFAEEAELTVGLWRWHPVELDGEPLTFSTTVPVTFLR